MNKGDLVDALESRLGSRRHAVEAVDAVIDVIVRAVAKGEKVAISGFGTFEKVQRAARTGRNPRSGKPVRIPKTNVPRFKAGNKFKTFTANPRTMPRVSPDGTPATARTSSTEPMKKAAAKKTTVKKTAAKKSSAKKTAAKKASVKKPTVKKAAAKKTTAKKSAAKKASVKKPTVKKAAAKKTTAKKSAAKKASVKKTAAKKSSAKKTARKAAKRSTRSR